MRRKWRPEKDRDTLTRVTDAPNAKEKKDQGWSPLARAAYALAKAAQQGTVPQEYLDHMNAVAVQAHGLDTLLGTRYVAVSRDTVVLELEITEDHLQPWGVTNGGVYAALGESAGSMAGFIAAGAQANVMGTNNSTDFLRPSKKGDVIVSTATPEHLGKTMQLWRVEHINKKTGKLCALTRLKTTVIPVSL